jgi:hypothetical protein
LIGCDFQNLCILFCFLGAENIGGRSGSNNGERKEVST